jgi:predicted RNase H-like HicB family nuclease
MEKRVYHINVIKEKKGYSATFEEGDLTVCTMGDTMEELKINLIEALELGLEIEGIRQEQFAFSYDLESFFDFYRVINAKALSERIGMNQSLLAQYIRGKKKPSPAQVNRILKGVQQIGKELTEVSFLV